VSKREIRRKKRKEDSLHVGKKPRRGTKIRAVEVWGAFHQRRERMAIKGGRECVFNHSEGKMSSAAQGRRLYLDSKSIF